MTNQFPIRLFADDADVRRVAAGLLDRSLPRAEWTHEAHLAACACLLLDYPDFVPERDLPGTIAAYNAAVGGVNDARQGYHETITQFYVLVVRAHLAQERAGTLAQRVNRLLASERGARDYPLRFWSGDLLFIPQARLGWAPPDLRPLAEC
ncbi:MAG: hypothetical protein V4647_12475 [Pseudomonadota bacterium]